MTWEEAGIVVRQETGFPDQESSRLTFRANGPTRLTLRIRVPHWAGPGFAVGAETSWQVLQFAGNVAVVTVKWELSLYGTGCGAAPAKPWHSVLLKHPGAVPAGAGVGGWPAGLLGDPGKWHCWQTGAFAGSVLVWL